MSEIQPYLNDGWDFLREGFHSVNIVLGLLIALFAAYRMMRWKQIWGLALVATIIHIIAVILIPVIDHNAALRLPPVVELSFWKSTAALYLGYMLVIGLLFFIKKKIIRSGR